MRYDASLIQEATRRGRDGYEEKVFFKNEEIGTQTRYSDRCLELLLQANIGSFKKKADALQAQQTIINIQLSDGTTLESINGSQPTHNNAPSRLEAEEIPDSSVEVHGNQASGEQEAEL